LEDAGITLVSITQNFGNDNEGFLLKGITNLLNEYYSKNNAKHTHEGMKVKAKAGLHVGGIPPLGYDVGEDRKLIINEDEAECVRLIFELFELNYSKKRIAEILNERGFKNKLGQPFRATSLDSVLRQEKYTGTYIWNRAHKANSEGKKNSHKSKPQEEIITIEDGCPMIISREQFDRVQEMISEKSSGRSHSKSRNNYMLGGLRIIKCAECGSYMIGNPRTSHGRKYMVYSCPKHKKNQCSMKEISTELLDVTVAKELVKEFITEENVKIATDKRNCKEYRQLKNKLKGNEKASLNILKAVETSYSDIVADKLKYLATSRKELQSKIEEYERTMPKVTPGELKKIQDRIMSLLIKSDDPEVKIFLKKAVREIVVRSTEVKIIMN
jgi:site-specific DNA recombinase